MRVLKALAATLAASVLAACAGQNVETLRNAQPTGSAFTRALVGEYQQIAAFEADEMYDWRDANYFARKGLKAADGEVVLPETVDNWDLPADKVDELSSARADLVALLDASGRRKAPELAAHAQGRYDCWIEQQEENHQPDHIARCRDSFYKALGELEAAMAPEPEPEPEVQAPEPEPEPMEPQRFVIYFGFDAAEVRQESMEKIQAAAALAEDNPDLSFSVTGHADRAGPEDYNRDLSLERAENVQGALMAWGVDPDDISIAARGESEPAVPTADGVREQQNRRVEILVQ